MKIEAMPFGGTTYTDLTPFVKEKGVTWSFNSVDADGAGRSLDGVMHRKQIAIKDKIELECRPLTSTELKTIRTLLENEWLTVRITTNAETVVFKGYRGATLSAAALVTYNNRDMWGNLRIAFIEQ